MKNLLKLGLIILILGMSSCSLFIDARIKRSASIDYALVKTALDEIKSGEKESGYGYDVLKMIEPSLKARLDYFYGDKPEEKE